MRALLAAKGRGSDMPPPVLVPDARTVDGLATDVPDYARALVAAFWPGPLTIVLRAQPSLMWDLGETGGTVALRMPDDPVALALLREVGPMAVSSANRTGHPARAPSSRPPASSARPWSSTSTAARSPAGWRRPSSTAPATSRSSCGSARSPRPTSWTSSSGPGPTP